MGKRILLVEDDAEVRSVVVQALRRADFVVDSVALVEHAFAALRSNPPDLVILDLGMPEGRLQGIDFLVALRENSAWHATPVVILSGLGDFINRDVTRRLNVAAIVMKPIVNFARFIDVVRGAIQ
jgi:DNA-binding response OmpR family regulator